MTLLNHIRQLCDQAINLYIHGNFSEAKLLTLNIEAHEKFVVNDLEKLQFHTVIAGCLVDIGSAAHDSDMVDRGTSYFQEWIDQRPDQQELALNLYNLANGYFAKWKFHGTKHINIGIDDENLRLARHYYRQAIQKLSKEDSSELACLLWTNYGNLLDTIGRYVEAIEAYDAALKINADMGMAVGNKAVALFYVAPVMFGYTHRFYLESQQLLQKSFEQSLDSGAKHIFERKLQEVESIVKAHKQGLIPEKVNGIEPSNDFHRFLCVFCSRHNLFLNPVSFLGDEGKAFWGDPVFISTMHGSHDEKIKFDRYVTFLNEIKQDYVLGRYLLVQSQYESAVIDSVDEGVTLVYLLDHSLNSTYIQLLKTAQKQAMDVLDKIAYFLYDYCGLTTPSADKVFFRQIFGGNKEIRADFQSKLNISLFALFTLAYDCSNKGDWNIFHDYRNELTHRFLVLHDENLPSSTDDIRRIKESEFLEHTIKAFQAARAAIMYLILFVENREQSNLKGSS